MKNTPATQMIQAEVVHKLLASELKLLVALEIPSNTEPPATHVATANRWTNFGCTFSTFMYPTRFHQDRPQVLLNDHAVGGC